MFSVNLIQQAPNSLRAFGFVVLNMASSLVDNFVSCQNYGAFACLNSLYSSSFLHLRNHVSCLFCIKLCYLYLMVTEKTVIDGLIYACSPLLDKKDEDPELIFLLRQCDERCPAVYSNPLHCGSAAHCSIMSLTK